ncbi:MAG: anthranilate synthase component I family protein [Myxococcota bacterium]
MNRLKPPAPRFDIVADLDTPVSAFLKLGPLKPRYLLESVEGGTHQARYSLIGFGEAETIVLRSTDPTPQGVVAWLREALGRAPVVQASPSPFSGGLVGFTSYDLVRRIVGLAPRPGEGLDAAYLAMRSTLVFDHVTRCMALLHDGPEDEARALRGEVERLLEGAVPKPRPLTAGPAQATLNQANFIDRVATVKEHIREGDVFQCVLSLAMWGEAEGDAFSAYRALRRLNPSPYLYYVDVAGVQVVGSSPEALVKLDGDQATLRPIAGTRPRGSTMEDDLALEADLLADAKEAAEHVMLVDLARNDLGRVAVPGTIRVAPSRSIERYSHVMHLVSGVQGTLEAPHDAFDLFASAFPAGTVTGAPKVRAMQIIDELEPEPRGIYAGTVGYFGHHGQMDQAIAIRTLTFADGRYRYQAGAGIVADSVPESEHAECLAKAAALRTTLDQAGGPA